MKRFTTIFITFVMMLLVTIMNVHAQTQTIYGRLIGYSFDDDDNKFYRIETDSGYVDAVAMEGLELSVGGKGFYTLEEHPNQYSEKYDCIIGYENLPEADKNVGYLCRAGYLYGDSVVYIYTDQMTTIPFYGITLNGSYYSSSGNDKDTAMELLKGYKGAVSYTTYDGMINTLDFITEPKQTITNQKYNTEQQSFDGLQYNITENTNILYMNNDENVFTGFNSDYIYSFDVVSYDRDKNARLIIINDIYAYGMGFCQYGGGRAYIIDEFGKQNRWEVEPGAFDDIGELRWYVMAEFTYDENGVIRTAVPIDGIDFAGYTYDKDKGTFGEYTLDTVPLMTAINYEGQLYGLQTLIPDDKYQYSGKVYTSSFGKTILCSTDSSVRYGVPIVDFWARDRDDFLKVYASYDKNGYVGNGMIYLAVYKQGNLCRVYSYSLADEGSTYDEMGDLTEVINGYVDYEAGDDPADYTVKGFIWYDNLSPMYPHSDVEIR